MNLMLKAAPVDVQWYYYHYLKVHSKCKMLQEIRFLLKKTESCKKKLWNAKAEKKKLDQNNAASLTLFILLK